MAVPFGVDSDKETRGIKKHARQAASGFRINLTRQRERVPDAPLSTPDSLLKITILRVQ